MSILIKQQYFSSEEYLELERQSPFKHEYRQGLVYAMAGSKKFHAQITSNLNMLLGNYLADKPCSVYIADMKIRIETANCYYYPDISVTCDKKDIEINNDFIVAPKLIIEVLSKSTEQFDRTDKFLDYQQISSLQEYILVSQDKIQVECYIKQYDGQWKIQYYGSGDIVEVTSIGLKCPIEQIYNKVHDLGITPRG